MPWMTDMAWMMGPWEVFGVLVGHPVVTEAAAIGVPDEIKGQAVVAFVVLQPDREPDETLRAALEERAAKEMRKPLAPKAVRFVRNIPKTRNAKAMQRVIRAAYASGTPVGEPPGDLSALVNPEAVEASLRSASSRPSMTRASSPAKPRISSRASPTRWG